MQLKNSTIDYLHSVITHLRAAMNSEMPISDEELIETIGFALDRLNLSARELAGKFGVTPSTITRWKNGKNMPVTFVRKAIFEQIVKIALEQLNALEESKTNKLVHSH